MRITLAIGLGVSLLLPGCWRAPPRLTTAEALLAGGRVAEQSFTRTFNFRLVQNLIIVPVRLGSQSGPRDFIVDSGAPVTLSSALVRELELPALARVAIAGPDSQSDLVPVTRLDRVEIGSVRFENVGAVVAWVEPPSPGACLSRSGLLGANLLHAAIWQIDFDQRTITVTDELAQLGPLDGAERIPFRRADATGSPRITVRVNDQTDASLLVDLGFNGSLAMPLPLYKATGNTITSDMPAVEGIAPSTVFKEHAEVGHIGRLGELGLGGLRVKDLPVWTGRGVSDFHIGIEFLRHFRVTLDWPHGNLYLEQRVPLHALAARHASFGFAPTLAGGELVVGSLWRTGPAALAGLHLGDRLVAIDGRDVARPTFPDLCRLLGQIGSFGTANGPIDVTIRRANELMRVRLSRTPLVPRRRRKPVPQHAEAGT